MTDSVVDYPKAYTEALVIAEKAPGTVCTSLSHYYKPGRTHPRHEVPYRQGYVHHYRLPSEHWHANEKSYRGCEQ